MEEKKNGNGFGFVFMLFIVAIASDLAASTIKHYFKKYKTTDTDKLPDTTNKPVETNKVTANFESVEVPESIKSTWDKIKGLESEVKNKLFTKFAESKIKKAV